ncbi:MAG: hypothetical protein HC784_03660 [Hydrococcus sp. CSU_1_8]|nr:hypothetical protein [Hydrococcus sp. CSU_1_8]
MGAKKVAALVVDFEELSPSEESERLHLERLVERSFYTAGKALQRLRDLRLYRNTHRSFDAYVKERFGYGKNNANMKILASSVVDELEKVTTNGGLILPTSERQVRPLTVLEPEQQRMAWREAVELAGGGVPPSRVVKDIVQRIREKNPVPNPFRVGEVCQIIAKDNPELRGKGGCWCIVSSVNDFSCTVDTFDSEYNLRPEYLKSREFTLAECKQMEELGARMTDLYQTGRLEEAALGVLNKLARIERAYLTELEENS